jgi:hypothetical protein
MSDRFLWPRLSPSRSMERRAELVGLEPRQARLVGAVDDPGAAVAPSGGRSVPLDRMVEVRDEIRRLADRHGWPDSQSAAEMASFDRAAAVVLHRDMAVLPADAAHDGVWHFVAMVLVPDVTQWRRPVGARSSGLGVRRHVFGRLWWRDHVLGDDIVEPATARPLSELELEHLFVRPALVADPAVARAVAAAVLSVEAAPARRAEVAEQLADSVLRRSPVVCFESLGPAELTTEIGALLALLVEVASS